MLRTQGIATALVLAIALGAAGQAVAQDASWLLHQADLEVARLTGQMPADAANMYEDLESPAAPEYGSSRKSPAIPMLMSLVLPGAGELYLGHKRGYVQIALDAASWYGAVNANQNGEDKKDEYYDYADEHWFEEKLDAAYDVDYLSRPDANYDYTSVVGDGRDYFPGTPADPINHYTDLPLWVSEEADRREYYENLGKWDQFAFGWDDFHDPRDFLDTEDLDIGNLQDPRTSANREEYRQMRQDSNDYFNRRDRFVYLSIAFRVFSVLQVAYLEGLLFGGGEAGGGTPDKFEVSGHEVDFFMQPVGYTRGAIGATVSF